MPLPHQTLCARQLIPPIQMLLHFRRVGFLSPNLRYLEGPTAEHPQTHTDRIQPLPHPTLAPIQRFPHQIGTHQDHLLLPLKYTSHNR